MNPEWMVTLAKGRKRRLKKAEKITWANRGSRLITDDNITTFLYDGNRGQGYAFKVSGLQGDSPQYSTDRLYGLLQSDTAPEQRAQLKRTKYPVLTCHEGALLQVHEADTNVQKTCAAGVNVATLGWVKRNYAGCTPLLTYLHERSFRLWLVSFFSHEVAAVPRNSEGKFRLFKGVVDAEVTTMEQLYMMGAVERPAGKRR
jgi:hypothetical protein